MGPGPSKNGDTHELGSSAGLDFVKGMKPCAPMQFTQLRARLGDHRRAAVASIISLAVASSSRLDARRRHLQPQPVVPEVRPEPGQLRNKFVYFHSSARGRARHQVEVDDTFANWRASNRFALSP